MVDTGIFWARPDEKDREKIIKFITDNPIETKDIAKEMGRSTQAVYNMLSKVTSGRKVRRVNWMRFIEALKRLGYDAE